eukprot:2686953-Pleurochrysis_carterae.AAC.2
MHAKHLAILVNHEALVNSQLMLCIRRKVDFLSGTSAVELIEPPKDVAQRFLNGDGPAPPRFARVTLVRGSADPPDVMEYKVGPILGCGTAGCDTASLETATIEPMLAPGAVPFQKRPYELSDVRRLKHATQCQACTHLSTCMYGQ